MNKAILNMYFRLVSNGRRTIDEIPEEYREAVQTMIDEANEETGDNADAE